MAEFSGKLENTKIWPDAQRILDNEDPLPLYRFTTYIHTVFDDLFMELFDTIVWQSDYVSNVSDYIYYVVKVGLGFYLEKVHPYRDNLEVTITREEIIDEKDKIGKNKISTRYKAILINSDRLYDGTYYDNISADQADKEAMVELQFQLVDKTIEVMKTIEVGGTYRNKTNQQILTSIIDSEFGKIVIDGKKGLDRISIIDADNKKQISNTVIPNGIRVVDIPSYLQFLNRGVYSTDVGTYITDYNKERTCFVYPLYNVDRYNQPVGKLTIISIPTTRYKYVEHTWMVDGNDVRILLGDMELTLSEGEAEYMDSGVGFRMTDGDAILKKPITITEEGPVTERQRLNYEVAMKNRIDGVDYSPMSRPSGNPFVRYSEISRKSGMLVSFNWFNSNPDLIYPAMPVMYKFLKNGLLTELPGCVVGKTSTTNREGIITTKVSLFILRYNYDVVKQ